MATSNLKQISIGLVSYQSGDGSPSHVANIGTVYVDNLTGNSYKYKNGVWLYVLTEISNSDLLLNGNLTVTGNTNLQNFSASTISGGTLYSGSTNLYSIFATLPDANDITRVQPGLNTYTGGTANLPTVNVSALTINTLSASGNSQLTSVTANTITISGNSDVSELLVIANSTQTKPLITLLKSDNTELLRIHSNTLENTFLGFSAGTSISSGLFNTFLGSGAGTGTTTGGVNVFVGHQAGSVITGGTSNVFIGAGAGKIKQSGDFNVYIGANAGGNTMAGNNNVYIGDWAGRFNYSGANNTYIGQASGYLSSGNSNVFLGFGAGVSVSGSNLLYIANSSTPNPLIFGNFSTSEVKINGTLSALTLSATSIYANVEISPIIDNNTDIGSSVKRFRSLNIVSGVSVSFTSTTRVTTPEIRLGNVLVYENNIVLTGDTIGGTVGGDDW